VPRVELNKRVVGTCLFTTPWTVIVVVTVEVLQGMRTVIVLVQLRWSPQTTEAMRVSRAKMNLLFSG